MTDAPKRIWVWIYRYDDRMTYAWHARAGGSGKGKTEYVRADIADEMLEAIKEFCCRVEVGEIRSKKTYAKFTAIIDKVEGSDT